MKILYRLFVALLFALILDGITKFWAGQALDLYRPVPVGGDFLRFTLGYNAGIAFGMFANGGLWPLIVTGVIIMLLLLWFARTLYSGQFPSWAAWPIGLLLGGAIGNFADRLLDGRVTDFLDVGIGTARWPTFNLADSFILIGVGLLMFLSFDRKQTDKSSEFEVPSEDRLEESGNVFLDP